jgi:hypothetical protein
MKSRVNRARTKLAQLMGLDSPSEIGDVDAMVPLVRAAG